MGLNATPRVAVESHAILSTSQICRRVQELHIAKCGPTVSFCLYLCETEVNDKQTLS